MSNPTIGRGPTPRRRRPDLGIIEPPAPLPESLLFRAETGADDPTPLLVPGTTANWQRARAMKRELDIQLRYRPLRAGRVELLAIWEHRDGTAMHRIISATDTENLRAAAGTLVWQVWRAFCARGDDRRGAWASDA